MTKKEAIEILSRPFDMKNVSQDILDAHRMAIEALEQESALDKIEEEINTPNRGVCDYYIVDRIEEIISKCKAESEVKE